MKLLEERIRKDGVVKEGNVLKVDSFLNHQMDVELFNEMGKEFKRLFADKPINKILTIEASGIGIACIVAQSFHVPVVFAKKSQSVNIDGDLYTSKVESFTHKRVYDIIVSKKFLSADDHVLIIDDFLANGCAVMGLIDLINEAGATLEGCRYCRGKRLPAGRKAHSGKGHPVGVPCGYRKYGRRYRRNQIPQLNSPNPAFCNRIIFYKKSPLILRGLCCFSLLYNRCPIRPSRTWAPWDLLLSFPGCAGCARQ